MQLCLVRRGESRPDVHRLPSSCHSADCRGRPPAFCGAGGPERSQAHVRGQPLVANPWSGGKEEQGTCSEGNCLYPFIRTGSVCQREKPSLLHVQVTGRAPPNDGRPLRMGPRIHTELGLCSRNSGVKGQAHAAVSCCIETRQNRLRQTFPHSGLGSASWFSRFSSQVGESSLRSLLISDAFPRDRDGHLSPVELRERAPSGEGHTTHSP